MVWKVRTYVAIIPSTYFILQFNRSQTTSRAEREIVFVNLKNNLLEINNVQQKFIIDAFAVSIPTLSALLAFSYK